MKTLKHKLLHPKVSIVLVVLAVVIGLCVAGCAPRQAPSGSSSDSPDDVASMQGDFVWSEDSDCSVCHMTEHASFEESQAAAFRHATFDCFDCHTDVNAIQVQHADVDFDTKMTKRLKKTSIDDELCLACHYDYSELAGKTVRSTVFTDNYGTVVNPHDLPVNDDHDSFTCAKCHDVHLPMEAEDYQDTCLGCHHANVYECGTCH